MPSGPSDPRTGPTPARWYRPCVMWEPERPWWGLKRLDEMFADAGIDQNMLPVRALYIGPITLTWLAKKARR